MSHLAFLATSTYDCVRTAPFHPRIHNLGNTGIGGEIHARLARTATLFIDALAYDGQNMRKLLADGMSSIYEPSTTVKDIGCGVGTLTCELANHFDVLAIDTSEEMLKEARRHDSRASYSNINAIDLDPREHMSDVSVACMLYHELPSSAHKCILDSFALTTTKDIWVVDIHPSYSPSETMRSGEPYIDAYLETIDSSMTTFCREKGFLLHTMDIIPSRVRAWVIRIQN